MAQHACRTARSIGAITLIALGTGVQSTHHGRALAADRTERHDLVTYTPPAGWSKEVGAAFVQYARNDGGDWGQIALYRSEPSEGGIHADFDRDWNELVIRPFAAARPSDTTEPARADGWAVMSGAGRWSFNGREVTTLLTTYSGHGVRLSILCNATAASYLHECSRFVASASLAAPGAAPPRSNPPSTGTVAQSPVSARLVASVWVSRQQRRHASGMGDNAGRSRNTYRFDRNGTYRFDNETFQYHTPKYYLVREEGTYALDGDVLTMRPGSGMWSRHANTPTDPALDTGATGHPALRYRVQFTSIYGRERLVLWPMDGNENTRDGSFNFHDGDLQRAYLYDAED